MRHPRAFAPPGGDLRPDPQDLFTFHGILPGFYVGETPLTVTVLHRLGEFSGPVPKMLGPLTPSDSERVALLHSPI